MLTLVKTSDAIPLVSIYEVADKKPGSKVTDKRQAAKKKQMKIAKAKAEAYRLFQIKAALPIWVRHLTAK